MSGRRGRPAGDRYEEPGGYDPTAGRPGEQLEHGYPAQPYGTPPVEAYGGGPEQAQYAQPTEYGGYGYPPEQYREQYQEQYGQPYADPQAYPNTQPYADPNAPAAGYGRADATNVLPAFADQRQDGYGGYEGATDVMPAITDAGPQGYGYDGATDVMPAITDAGPQGYGYDGATDVMPAIVDAGSADGAEHTVDYGSADLDSGYPDAPSTDYDHTSGAEPDPGSAAEPGVVLAKVPAPRRGDSPTRAARSARTPIWDPPGFLPALLTVGLAAVLAVTAIAGKPALVLGVAFLQVLTAVGWFRLNGMWPARQGIALVVVAAFGTDAAVYAKGQQGLASVPAVLAGALLLSVLLQARSGARPGELLPALTVTTSAALITAFDVAYLVAGELSGGPIDAGAAVVGAALAAGVATLVRAVPLPDTIAPIPSWLLGTAAGAAGGVALGGEAPYAALLGAGAAALGLLGRRIAGYDHPSRFVHFTAGVSLPLALAAPAAYLLGRVMIG
ncbi:hypothetical protein [Embleya sp. AB8]|uniref:hypothetical protein n=1 Tax=Embleya sp. AB8 TaxID=3156304 RepID=UPI003C72C5D1